MLTEAMVRRALSKRDYFLPKYAFRIRQIFHSTINVRTTYQTSPVRRAETRGEVTK